MKTCVLVCAGDFAPELFKKETGDFVVAVDGGYAHLAKAGVKPDAFVGDGDSLGYIPDGVEAVKLPCEKDETDSFAAYRYARLLGYTRFSVYGALGGGRVSHGAANFGLLLKMKKDGCDAVMIDPRCTVRVLCGQTVRYAPAYCKLSLISASPRSVVTVRGMKYEATDAVLENTDCLCVSNEMIGKEASVTVSDGYVFEIIEK